jgi:hypothetical protein
VAKVASTSKKPPHHDRVVAGGDDNQIDGDYDHDFNGHEKARLLEIGPLADLAIATENAAMQI